MTTAPWSSEYWERRYAAGHNSGAGSYGALAEFKADVINRFVARNSVQTVIEFGCGDGAQLELADYRHYVGYDVSETVLTFAVGDLRTIRPSTSTISPSWMVR